MKFTYTNKKSQLPKDIKYYTEKKFSKLDRYFNSEPELAVVFSTEKDQNRIEATLRCGGIIIRASESSSDMHASVDSAVAFIERKLRRNKTRLEKNLRKGAFSRGVSEEDAVTTEAVIDDDIDSGEDELTIVRTKHFPIKPMSCEEAVLEMNLLGHSFFAFKDEANDGAFAVVYQRKNGDYGLIEDDG